MPRRSRDENTAYMRRYRAGQKAEAEAKRVAEIPPWPADPVRALCEWAEQKLKVPPGHPTSGQPMVVPGFAAAFVEDLLQDGVIEALLCMGRKNAKSAIIAALALAFLVGPLRRDGWRAGVASVTKEKAGELKAQMEAIALASELEGLRFLRSPAPGKVESQTGTVDILSADASAGHASGFDLAMIDELGLLGEKNRGLVSGMRSSISARAGKFLSLTIWGSGPFVPDIVAQRDDPSVVVHLYQAEAGCQIDDEAAWYAANPGLGSIKSLEYMQASSRLVMNRPADQSHFRSHDLNQPGEPGAEVIVDFPLWQACEVDEADLPPREGECFIGFDLGGSASLTALAAYWPDTGRLEAWGACGNRPDLKTRGVGDGVGDRYEIMANRGELKAFPGRTTPLTPFFDWVQEELAGTIVTKAAADRYRQSEGEDALRNAEIQWEMDWRPVGAGPSGGEDIRAFQKAVQRTSDLASGAIETADGNLVYLKPSLLLASAIQESIIRYDANSNPGLDKRRNRGRIDALSAAVLAIGLGNRLPEPDDERPFSVDNYVLTELYQ